MLYIAKVGIIISVLTAFAAWAMQIVMAKPSARVGRVATYATVGSLSFLCISQIWVALFGVGMVTTAYARRRIYAAGLAIFLIITMPGIGITLMAGGVQLINVSIATAVIISLLFSSMAWKGRFKSARYTNNYSAYAIVAVLTFITARDTTLTNVMRVALENIVSYIVPYFLVRNSLRDGASVRAMTMFVVVAGLAVSAVAIFESFMVWPIYQAYGQSFGTLINAGVKMRGGMLRAAGPSMNPPLSAAVLALCFVTAFASADLFKSKGGHRLVLLVIALGLFSMQSRVGWLGAIAGSIGVLISKRGVRAFAIYVPIIILAFGGVYGLAQVNERFANLAGFSADAKGSSEYRDQMSERGIEIVKQHPLIGQSVEVVSSQMQDLKQGEGIIDFVNGYLSVALFSGLIGLAVFASALIYQAYNSYSGQRLATSQGAGSLANIGLGIAIGAVVMFPFVPTDYRIVLVTTLLFALSNAVITHSHINYGVATKPVRPRRNLIAESGRKAGDQPVLTS